ncbi:hypothetical protein QJS10_CPB13g01542 [Acorus calamus]|uniref:Condensation domain-containing protein n=2 Tax=Acorus calamus TaxID=4465 RepID=A0AAV9DF23_ACOCL|nr:hypothetical protein QJS10_CPB13g01542 [Acorus calamus]
MDTQAQTQIQTRPLGGTESTFARAVPGGTGITVVAALLTNPPSPSSLENALLILQTSHPILRASLDISSSTLTIPSSPQPLELETHDPASTSDLLAAPVARAPDAPPPPLHLLLERELSRNPWASPAPARAMHATLYALPARSEAVLALRFHASVCDRKSAVTAMREVLHALRGVGVGGGGGAMSPVMEDMIPSESAWKPFWARGMDLVGYSVNAFRSANLAFEDARFDDRSSEVVRVSFGVEESERIINACQVKGIKLCGALVAAALMAAHASKNLEQDQPETYSVVALIDCRKILRPPLDDHAVGFYHSGILNTHTIRAGEDLWEVAHRCYKTFSDSKASNKHFTDVGDLNFLMCKAIDNPALTPSSSMRTAFLSVFEDPLIIDDGEEEEFGVADCIGCSSVHGVGPSLGVFDTVRDGRLECVFVYPVPLHSRRQVEGLVEDMKMMLIEAT